MKLILFITLVTVLDVLRVCQAVTCTPATANTCTKSKYITGQCVDGLCECVSGTVPNDYGCHKPFKPTLDVDYPISWSGEVRPEGHLFIECDPKDFEDGNYRWYKNGTEWEGEVNYRPLILNPTETLNYQCAVNVYGRLSEKSDPLLIPVGVKDTPFTVRPVLTGMVKYAGVNSTIRLHCANAPATYMWYRWYIDGEKVDSNIPGSYSIDVKITADRFNKPVICEMEYQLKTLNMKSDPVSTPTAPAGDIPGVIVKGENQYRAGDTLTFSCDISEIFAIGEDDVIAYTWIGPDGNVIPQATKQTFYHAAIKPEQAGTYFCTASYNGQTAKRSPSINVVIDARPRSMAKVEPVPKKMVLGGYLALVCTVPDQDVSSTEFVWIYFELGQSFSQKTLSHYTDNVIQINNATNTTGLALFYYCSPKGYSYGWGRIPKPVRMSASIKPTIAEIDEETIQSSYVLSCDSDFATPGTRFDWYVDDVKQADHSSSKIGLEAKTTSTEVKCQMFFKSDLSGFSDAFTIPASGELVPPVIQVTGNLPSPPPPTTTPSFIQGLSYTLICASSSHNESATYAWNKGNVELGITTRNYSLAKIQSGSNGLYTCTITIGAKTEQSPKALEINVATSIASPVVEVFGKPSVIVEGQSYSLVCSSQYTAEQGVSYAWLKDGSSLGADTETLQLPDIQPVNNGDYTCIVTVGDLTAIAANAYKLVVTTGPEAPSIGVTDSPKSFIVGGSYALVCSTSTSDESAVIGWKKGTTDISDSNEIHFMSNITKSDSGNYTCTITLRGKSNESQPLEVAVTDEGKYCTAASDCTGTGVDQKRCVGLQCECLPTYKIKGSQCVTISSSTNLQSSTVLIILATVITKLAFNY